jgi:soluble lytic murein transglycosylase
MKLRKTKMLALASLALGIMAMGFFVVEQRSISAKGKTLEQNVWALRNVVRVDTARTAQIRRIEHIITVYNPALDLEVKEEIAQEIYDMSVKYPAVDVNLICATITHESAYSWDPTIKSNAGALGLMQIMPATGQYLAELEGIKWTSPEEILFDPVLNIRLGTRYLSMLVETYEVDGGLAAYNGGAYRAQLWLEAGRRDDILWRETRDYVPAVLALYDQFKQLRPFARF